MNLNVAVLAALTAALAAEALSDVLPYAIVDGISVPEPLGGLDGDAERGRTLYFDRERGRCFTCHGSPGGPGVEGNAAGLEAPPLTGVAARLSPGEIRLWIIAPDVLAEGTAMPGYYTVGGRNDPADPLYGEPLLGAQEVEDLVAWLSLQTTE